MFQNKRISHEIFHVSAVAEGIQNLKDFHSSVLESTQLLLNTNKSGENKPEVIFLFYYFF